MLRVSEITASAAAHGTSAMLGEAAPPSGSGPFARLVNRRLTSAPASGAYNWPAASGQRHDVRPAPDRGAQAGFPDIGRLQTA